MTIFRLIASKNLSKKELLQVIDHFNNWEEVQNYFKEKPKGTLLNKLTERIRDVNISVAREENMDIFSAEFKSIVFVPGTEDLIWVTPQDCRIILPLHGFLILQQPTQVFEKLFRLSLEKVTQQPPKSPFESISVESLFSILADEFKTLEYATFVNRTIYKELKYDSKHFAEFNIKQPKIPIDFIRELDKNSKRWHAFTVRASKSLNKEREAFSIRIDCYGNILLYGKYYQDRAILIREILSATLKRISNL